MVHLKECELQTVGLRALRLLPPDRQADEVSRCIAVRIYMRGWQCPVESGLNELVFFWIADNSSRRSCGNSPSGNFEQDAQKGREIPPESISLRALELKIYIEASKRITKVDQLITLVEL
jgi:hypothetical protein